MRQGIHSFYTKHAALVTHGLYCTVKNRHYSVIWATSPDTDHQTAHPFVASSLSSIELSLFCGSWYGAVGCVGYMHTHILLPSAPYNS